MNRPTNKYITTKTVSAKLYALKHALYKRLEKSLENDKNLLKEGAKLTCDKYCTITLSTRTKTTLDRNKVEALCSKIGVDISTLENHTSFYRVDISNIPEDIDTKITSITNNLETNNDKIITRIANAIRNGV